MALRTVIYLRKSTQDKDEKQIHSISRQSEDILNFIEKYNKIQPLEERLIYNEKKDLIAEDASAKYPGRRKFNQMMELLKKHKYDVLLCTDLSRLSRNAVDNGALVQALEDKHIKRVQTMDKVFTTTPTDKFTLNLFLSVAKYENDQRAVNTQSGMAHRKNQGATTHKAPMGYINVGEKKGDKYAEPDPETCESVREIWELFLTGDYTVSDLKKEGDQKGITVFNKQGERRLPVQTTYRNMLRNKYYAGYIQKVDKEAGLVEWIKGEHQALISEEEFEQAQLTLQSRGYKHQSVDRSLTFDVLLNEILICGKCQIEIKGIRRPTRMVFEEKTRYTCSHCKHRFSAATKKPCPQCGTNISNDAEADVRRYYRCAKQQSSHSCAHDFYGTGKMMKNVKAEDIETYLDTQLSQLYISESLFNVFKKQLYTLWLNNNESVKKRKTTFRKQLDKLEEERIKIQRRGLDKTNMSLIEKEDYDQLMDRNKTDQMQLEEQITDLKEDEEERFEKAWQSLQALREAKTVFGSQKLGFEPKRKLLLSLISNLKITDNNWEVIWKKPFAELANAGIARKAKKNSDMGSDDDKVNWLSKTDAIKNVLQDTGYCERLQMAMSQIFEFTILRPIL